MPKPYYVFGDVFFEDVTTDHSGSLQTGLLKISRKRPVKTERKTTLTGHRLNLLSLPIYNDRWAPNYGTLRLHMQQSNIYKDFLKSITILHLIFYSKSCNTLLYRTLYTNYNIRNVKVLFIIKYFNFNNKLYY